ncbi:hypothetical protein [Tateyamaria sp. SN3-11]|uniref:hypothetical protein n=1 Tax=Tateyamaria sp. SN3-11 TaxID=3092147 RepID=UPI0039EB6568
MSYVVSSIPLLLAANALIAFGVAFYWQAKIIFTLFGSSDWDGALSPCKDLANPNGVNNTFGRFIAGEIFPELRRKWAKAIGYVAVSWLTLFAMVGFLQIVAPEYLP